MESKRRGFQHCTALAAGTEWWWGEMTRAAEGLRAHTDREKERETAVNKGVLRYR